MDKDENPLTTPSSDSDIDAKVEWKASPYWLRDTFNDCSSGPGPSRTRTKGRFHQRRWAL